MARLILDIRDISKEIDDAEKYPVLQGIVKEIVFVRKGINKVPVVRFVTPVKVAEKTFARTLNLEYPYNILILDAYVGNEIKFKFIDNKAYLVQ